MLVWYNMQMANKLTHRTFFLVYHYFSTARWQVLGEMYRLRALVVSFISSVTVVHNTARDKQH